MADRETQQATEDQQAFSRGGKEKGAWPQHELLANYVRYGILTGEYPPGSLAPSTRQLQELFGVAPQTIKNANDLLAEEGLVTSQRGKGIVVQPHRQHVLTPALYKEPAEPGKPYRWLDSAENSGRRASGTLLEVGEVEPPADVRDAMGLEEGRTAMLRSQLLSLDDEPAELVKSYYPINLARGTALAEHKKIKGGTPRALADMGFPPTECVDDLAPLLPPPEMVLLLNMPSKLPTLRTLRVVYSGERIIEVTEMVKAGHLYKVRYRF